MNVSILFLLLSSLLSPMTDDGMRETFIPADAFEVSVDLICRKGINVILVTVTNNNKGAVDIPFFSLPWVQRGKMNFVVRDGHSSSGDIESNGRFAFSEYRESGIIHVPHGWLIGKLFDIETIFGREYQNIKFPAMLDWAYIVDANYEEKRTIASGRIIMNSLKCEN